METKIRIGFLLALFFTKALCETGIVKIQRDKLFSGHVMFETSTPMWLPCAKLCSRITACKSINFIAGNKTCQINNEEPGNHTDGLIPAVGTIFVAEPSFREVHCWWTFRPQGYHHPSSQHFGVDMEINYMLFEGPCEHPVCKLNEICLPKALVDICVPLFALYGEFKKRISIMTVDNGGMLGDWSETEFCSEGHFAIGYVMKIEKNQGGGDDTSLNAIRLYCANPDWTHANNSMTIMGQDSRFGFWRDVAMCSYGEVMVSYSLQFERLFNGDNTAANYVRFKCRNINSASFGTTLGTSGLWGDYGAWSEYCAVGSAICGLKVRIQLPQGLSIDDTALNDVHFFCCKN